MGKKEKNGLVDTIQFGNRFGLFDEVDKLKEKYRAFVGWRAIMERGQISFVFNRNCAYGMNSDIKKIEKFMQKSIKKLTKWAWDEGVASSKECHFGEYFWDESIEGVASPRASYGYLYIQIGILK